MLNITRRLLSKHCRPSSINSNISVRGLQQKMDKLADILSQPLVDSGEDSNIFDIVAPWRTEEIHTVEAAESMNGKDLFCNTSIPQNPWMAENNWNSPHQDSYCSESVGLDGPNGTRLKLIKQYNPYGFVPTMVCNQHSQLIGVSFKNGIFRLITFDNNCNILTSNIVNRIQSNSFGGGYFYLNHHNDTIVVQDQYHLACYNTSDCIPTEENGEIGELPLKWKSQSLREMMLLKGYDIDDTKSIYSTLPVWRSDGNKYWVLMPGEFNYPDNNTTTNPVQVNAYIAVMEVKPNENKKSELNGYKCDSEILAVYPLPDQYVNNTLAADEHGVYLVTNKVTKDEKTGTYHCNEGDLVKLIFSHGDEEKNESAKIELGFASSYCNVGYRKYGTANIGSGTTPTIFSTPDDPSTNYVTIGDNASPQMNICIYDSNTGDELSKTGVFSKMRSGDEASFIGVNGRIVAENNFGHAVQKYIRSQYVANEPGMTMIKFDGDDSDIIDNKEDNIIWNNDNTYFFAMSMLCRESGIIYAYTCDWYDDESATKGGMFYISAIDSFDGRTVWRIPIGRGHPYQHSVGGIYFDRTGKNLFVGSYDFLVSIQNFDDEKKFL